jgi:hypothetical protein
MTHTKDEALKLALEALDNLLYWDNGKPEYDEAREAITAIKQALALDKKADNARELGLDYEPVLKDNSNYRYDPPVAEPVQSCYCPNCEAMGKELAALKAQPAVPDALFRHAPEHPQYIEGWNDCRAEMLKGMKP